MSAHHLVLAAAYYPLKLARAIGRPLGLSSRNQLRVLIYHDVAPAEQARFAEQLRWLARSWNFVPPDRFSRMVTGEEAIRGRNLLLSFDDGFASNRVVAEEVLRPLGIRALFFVVSDLVRIEDRTEARRFMAERLFPEMHIEKLPEHWSNLGWRDLEALLEQGHCIGCHTASHARLSAVKTQEGLEREIVSSAQTLEQHLGVPIEHFSYTFGDLESFSEAALAIARRRFRFVYSGLRGDNARDVSPFALRRDSAADQDALFNYRMFPDSLLGSFLEGAADVRYARSRARLDDWSREEC
jgi:peptidoglycan/xylan/chitin deacetylase (PgdA/CDA1 family)